MQSMAGKGAGLIGLHAIIVYGNGAAADEKHLWQPRFDLWKPFQASRAAFCACEGEATPWSYASGWKNLGAAL